MSDPVPADQPRALSTDGLRPADPNQRPGGLASRTAEGAIWQRQPAPQAGASTPAGAPAAGTSSSPAPAPSSVIGRLSRVRASDLWPDGRGLATWLAASPEPLSEALDKPPFEFATSESNILLGTSADQHAVCVVCEAGPSSDEGLGVLLRVAAVQEGGIVVWLAGEIGDAHVAALSWLNRSTSPRYYLVRVTGVRIDASASAPMFELVARPPRAPRPEGASDESGREGEAPRRRVEDHVEAHAGEPAAEG